MPHKLTTGYLITRDICEMDEPKETAITALVDLDDLARRIDEAEAEQLIKQLAALKAELREICAAIDDPACDLTLTAVECIKKLKAENASLKRDAERLDFILRKQLIVIQDYDDKYFTYNAQSGKRGPEMDSEAEAIDAAIAKGEKG